jgi:hypothetical protein
VGYLVIAYRGERIERPRCKRHETIGIPNEGEKKMGMREKDESDEKR